MDQADGSSSRLDPPTSVTPTGDGVGSPSISHAEPNSDAEGTEAADDAASRAQTTRLRPNWLSEPFTSEDPERTSEFPPVDETLPDQFRHIGPYQIQGVLAQGGMGVIYRALDTRLKRPVALKMILSGAHACPTSLARFRGEAEAVARLQHTNIVQIFEVGDHQGLPFLALEYVEGATLMQKLAETPFTPRAAAELVRTLAWAVEFAHQRGIIHRDLKPGNILMTKQGVPKITDFGLAKLKGATDTFSRPGEVIGTPNYMAPEQAEGDPNLVGPVADVYSLGAVLYELLTNRPPFLGGSPMETLMRLRVNDVVRPSFFQPKAPRDLETICMKCLEKERHRRYPSAAELAEDLGRYLDSRTILARPAGPFERVVKWSRRHPTLAFVTVTMLVSVLVSNATIISQWRAARAAHVEIERRNQELVRLQADMEREQAAARDAQERADRFDYLAKLNQAEREFATGDAAKAIELLEQCNPRMRSWEWEYLRRRVEGSAATVPLRPGEVAGMKFTPDNRTLATVTIDGRIVRRQSSSGKLIRVVRLNRGDKILESSALTRGAFSPDSRLVAAGCDIRQAQGNVVHGVGVWESETGDLKHVWELPIGEPLRFAFRGDGLRLAATTGRWSVYHGQSEWHGDGVAVYDLAAGKPLWTREISPDEPSYVGLCFAPGSSRLALTRRGTLLAFWDGETGGTLREIKSPELSCYSVVADSRGEHFAVCEGNRVFILDQDGKRLAVLSGHSGLVSQAAFSADGRQLLTSGLDHILRRWSVPINPTAINLVGHTSAIALSDISGDGKRAASFGHNGELKIWDAAGNDPPALFTNSGREWTPGVAFGPGMKWLASGSGDGQLIVWDMSNGRRLRTIRCPEGISSLAVSPDGSKVAVGYDRHGAALWDPRSGKLIGKLPIDQSINGVAFSPDGRFLLTVGAMRHAGVWDVASLTMATRFVSHTGNVTCGAFSPNGQVVATADQTGAVVLWNPTTGRVVQSIQAHATRVSCVAFSPDGKTLATANGNRHSAQLPVQIRLWDTQSGKMKLELKGHELSIWCLAFSPNGDRLMSGSEDKTIMIWDTRRGQLMMTLKGHTDDVRCLAFSPDGNVLASSNDDNHIRFWDATPVFNGPGIKARFLDYKH